LTVLYLGYPNIRANAADVAQSVKELSLGLVRPNCIQSPPYTIHYVMQLHA
jgi:hypothetical protein